MRQGICRACADAEFQRQVAGIIETVGEAAQALTAATTRLTYDTMGRIQTWAANGGSTNTKDYATQQAGCTYYSNPQPHAVRSNTQGSYAPNSFCYDANGNMTEVINSGTVTGSYSWTSFNQPSDLVAPTANSSSQFFYDQNHQRYKQVASYSGSPETTEYIGGLTEKMTNSTGTTYRYYVPAGNNFVVYNRWTNGTNALDYVTKDNIGSSAVITDHTGAVVVSEKYAALGWNENTSAQEATMATISRHEFTGQEGLDNSGLGLVNMNGRIYHPSGSMFLSPDPNVFEPENTQDYNRYSYVHDNPLTYVDPTGFGISCNDYFITWYITGSYGGVMFSAGFSPGGSYTSCDGTPDGPGTGANSDSGDLGSGGGGGKGGNALANQAKAVPSLGLVLVSGSRVPPAFPVPELVQFQNGVTRDALLLGTISIDFTQQSNPPCAYVACPVVQAQSPLHTVTPIAQYEYPLNEPPLGDGILDFLRQAVAALTRPPHEVLSPQDLKDAGINFQTGHYINRVGPENVGPVEETAEGIVNDPNFVPGTSACFTCNGVNYEMRTYVLPDGTINVGTIFPIE